MKEICIDIRMAFHSGIGTYIRHLLPFLKDAGLSLRVLAPISHLEKWPELKSYDLIPVRSPIYSIQEQFEFPLRIPSCDLFWTPHYNIPLAPIRARKRLVSIHDIYHLVYGAELGWKKQLYAKIWIEQAVRRSDGIITISTFSKKEILRVTSAKEEKIAMIYLGVDQKQFTPAAEDELIQAIKNRYQLPADYFIFVGNLAPHKNLIRLIRAWPFVQERHCNFKLVLVGKKGQDASYENVFKEFPLLRNSVVELGKVDQKDLPTLYQLAKGAILPSLYEGFGLTPLEAMAMDCPVIVSNAASLPEVCQEASLYVDPYDEQDIAQKICLLIENPEIRQNLIEKGRQRINCFSWEKSAQSHLEIIHRILSS